MSEATGVIHDIGYQRYDGVRLGRRHVVGSLYLHGLRTAFGLGRSAKAKAFPWLIVGIVGAVAVVLAAVRAQTGEAAPRWQIVLPKLAVAAGVTAVTVAVPLYVAGVLADSVRLGMAPAAASVVGAAAYPADGRLHRAGRRPAALVQRGRRNQLGRRRRAGRHFLREIARGGAEDAVRGEPARPTRVSRCCACPPRCR